MGLTLLLRRFKLEIILVIIFLVGLFFISVFLLGPPPKTCPPLDSPEVRPDYCVEAEIVNGTIYGDSVKAQTTSFEDYTYSGGCYTYHKVLTLDLLEGILVYNGVEHNYMHQSQTLHGEFILCIETHKQMHERYQFGRTPVKGRFYGWYEKRDDFVAWFGRENNWLWVIIVVLVVVIIYLKFFVEFKKPKVGYQAIKNSVQLHLNRNLLQPVGKLLIKPRGREDMNMPNEWTCVANTEPLTDTSEQVSYEIYRLFLDRNGIVMAMYPEFDFESVLEDFGAVGRAFLEKAQTTRAAKEAALRKAMEGWEERPERKPEKTKEEQREDYIKERAEKMAMEEREKGPKQAYLISKYGGKPKEVTRKPE